MPSETPELTCYPVYVGRAASLSFLQLLRDTVTQHIGPSQFSHNVKLEDMLETEAPKNVSPGFEDQLDLQQRQALLRAYQIAVSHTTTARGLLNLVRRRGIRKYPR